MVTLKEYPITEAVINEDIKFPEVRLIKENGDQVGIVPTAKALSLAKDLGLDLVLVAENSNPPVAKILDFSKYRYELEHKVKEARHHQRGQGIKEVRFRLKIDQNDFNIKVNNVIKFLKSGDKVKVQIQFRGREQQHPQLGVDLLEKVGELVEGFGAIAIHPTIEGRNVTMVIDSKVKAEQTISEQRRRGAEAKDARAARQAARLAAKGIDAHGNKIAPASKQKPQQKPQEKIKAKENENA